MRTSRPPRCFGIVFCSPPRQQAYPSLRLDMRETQTAVLTGELIAGDLDCVLLALPVKHADVETAALFRDRFLLAAPAAGLSVAAAGYARNPDRRADRRTHRGRSRLCPAGAAGQTCGRRDRRAVSGSFFARRPGSRLIRRCGWICAKPRPPC